MGIFPLFWCNLWLNICLLFVQDQWNIHNPKTPEHQYRTINRICWKRICNQLSIQLDTSMLNKRKKKILKKILSTRMSPKWQSINFIQDALIYQYNLPLSENLNSTWKVTPKSSSLSFNLRLCSSSIFVENKFCNSEFLENVLLKSRKNSAFRCKIFYYQMCG